MRQEPAPPEDEDAYDDDDDMAEDCEQVAEPDTNPGDVKHPEPKPGDKDCPAMSIASEHVDPNQQSPDQNAVNPKQKSHDQNAVDPKQKSPDQNAVDPESVSPDQIPEHASHPKKAETKPGDVNCTPEPKPGSLRRVNSDASISGESDKVA